MYAGHIIIVKYQEMTVIKHSTIKCGVIQQQQIRSAH